MKVLDLKSGFYAGLILLALTASLPANAWVKTLSFDDGVLGGKSVGEDAYSGSTASTYDNAHVFGDSGQSSKQYIQEGKTAYGVWGGVITLPEPAVEGQEVWVRVRTYYPSNFTFDANPHLKFIRFHTRSDTRSNGGYNDWYIDIDNPNNPFFYIYEGTMFIEGDNKKRRHYFGSWDTDRPQHEVWETYEMYVRFGSKSTDTGGLGLVRMWQNGRLVGEFSNEPTLFSADAYSSRIHLFTYWNGGAPATQNMWVDDVILTNEQPEERDANGNSLIGTGGYMPVNRPMPPQNIVTQ